MGVVIRISVGCLHIKPPLLFVLFIFPIRPSFIVTCPPIEVILSRLPMQFVITSSTKKFIVPFASLQGVIIRFAMEFIMT